MKVTRCPYYSVCLLGNISLHDLLECLHRLLGIQGVAVEIETEDLTFVGLILECRGGGQGLGGIKQIEAVVGVFSLFGSNQGDATRRLGSIDGVRGWVLLGRLGALAMTRQDHKRHTSYEHT